MATIPLIALQGKAPEQQDSLQQYGRLLQIKNMQREAQMQAQEAPLRQQALQQQVQEGQINLHKAQREQRDQDALSAAMQEWGKPKIPSVTSSTGAITIPESGEVISAGKPLTVTGPAGAGAQTTSGSPMPDYDELVNLAKKNGASFAAIKGLQSSILEMRDKASTIAKNDAQTGQANANALKTKNGMIIDAMSGALNLPDNQLSQGILAATQELSGKGLLDPQHIKQAQQLAQLGDPAQMRQQLSLQIKALGGYNKILEDAQKKAQTEQEQGKSDPNSPFYAPSQQSVAMGTAPGAAQIQAGEAKQAGRKAAAEAAARQPFELALARQRQALSQGDPNAAGQLLVDGDATLSQLKARGSTPEFIQSALNAAKRISGGKYNAQEAEANFKVAESPAQLAFFGSAKSLTDPGGTLDQLAETGKQLPGGKFPAFNKLADWEKAATGTGPIAQYAAEALGYADDYAKVVGGGVGTDTARQAALDLLPKNASPEARAAALQGIRGTVHSQMKSRIGKNPVLQRMYGEENATNGGSADAPAKIGVGGIITQGGHKFKVTAVDANGKPTSADPL
jgi:hypothetical protein